MMRQSKLGGLLKWRNLRSACFMLGASPFLSDLVPKPGKSKSIIPIKMPFRLELTDLRENRADGIKNKQALCRWIRLRHHQ
jgi:hypothetical protein